METQEPNHESLQNKAAGLAKGAETPGADLSSGASVLPSAGVPNPKTGNVAQSDAGAAQLSQNNAAGSPQRVSTENPLVTPVTGEGARISTDEGYNQTAAEATGADLTGNVGGEAGNAEGPLADLQRTQQAQAQKRGRGRPAKIQGPDANTPPLTNSNLGAMKPGELEALNRDPEASAAASSDAPEDSEEANQHNANVAKYGTDYVTAVKKQNGGEQTQVFSRTAWDMLGPNKEGYKRTVKVPDEVKELQK